MRARRPLVLGAVLALALAGPAAAQELACRVNVDAQRLNRQDVQFLRDLGADLERYLNDRRWTDDSFTPEERIECDVSLVFLQALSQTRFKASYALTTRRPVYGTTQRVTVLQVLDQDWEFEYIPGTALTFDPSRYDPLLSVVNFYAYLSLGYDYDTFAPLGGTPFFERARTVAQVAEGANGTGWAGFGTDRSRTRLVAQLVDRRYDPLRRAAYDVHYGAMDHFVNNPEAARTVALEALRALKALFDDVQRQYTLDIFFTTRASDLVSMLERSPMSGEAYTLLLGMDPARQNEYNRLVN